MANIATKAVLKAKIGNEILEILVKTGADLVYIDESTTLADKLTEILGDLSGKATAGDITAAVNALKTELMGEGVPEAYNTFKELADYITSHQDAADALTTAIGNKADKSVVDAIKTTVDALGTLATKSTVSEGDLDAALAEKVNAASEGNHAHNNKAVLDTITAAKVSAWDGKSKIHISETEPASLAEGDLWIQTIV